MSAARMVALRPRGIMPAVFTPLNEDRSVNCKEIPLYAQYLTKNGIKSVLVGGTTGEATRLSLNSRKQVIDAWVDVSRLTGLHIQVQVGGAPFPDVIDLTQYCAENGVHSILTLPELYFRPQTVEELVSNIDMIAKAACGLPVFYYHNPKMTNVNINMAAFAEEASAQIPNFKGMKFSSTDLVEAAQVLKVLREDQTFFIGGEHLLAPAALLGIKSCISCPSNLFPRQLQAVLDAVEESNIPKARELQQKLTLAINSVSVEGHWLSSLKAAMEIISGLRLGPPALPQIPLSNEVKRRIEGKLKAEC